MDEIRMDDITLTFLRSRYPRKLMGRLKRELKRKGDYDNFESLIQVITSANRAFFGKMRLEEKEMYETLKEIFREDIEEEIKEAVVDVVYEAVFN